MAIRQKPMGVIKRIGSGVNFRTVRKAKLAPGVAEVKAPRAAWRLK